MSDSEEYEYEYDSDDAYNSDEQLDGSDAEGCDEKNAARETLIELENTYYEAEDQRQRGDLTGALELFEKVVALEQPLVEQNPESMKWSFQAFEHIVKICAHTHQWDVMLTKYAQMLTFLPFVTRNESTDSISSILDVVSVHASAQESSKYSSKMYEITLERLKGASNERLWFTMNVKLGKLLLDMHAFPSLRRLLDELYAYCALPDGAPDASKVTALLDVYALDIQWCGATKNSTRLREIYPKTLGLDAAVADPRVMGVVREEGGKMYLEERQWMLAYNEFFESFRNYQEAGNVRATQSLKYVVLSNMLASSTINPFDSREAKVYQDNDEINGMLVLRSAYEASDVVEFERVLQNPKYKLLSDPLMSKYLHPLLRTIRCHVLKKIVRPYTVIQLASLATTMHISQTEVEDIAVALIQTDELDAKIDQKRGLLALQMSQVNRDANKLFDALANWTLALDRAHGAIVSRVTTQH